MVQDLGHQRQRSKVSLWTYQVTQQALGHWPFISFVGLERSLVLGHSSVPCRITLVGGGQGWNQDSRLGMGVCFGWCLLGILKSASDRLNPHACLGVCLNPSALGVTLYAPLCPMSPPPGWLERPRGCLQMSTLGRAGEPAAATCGEAPPAPSAGRSTSV